MLLHLKRFHYTSYFRDKVCDLVHFPIKSLNLGPYVLGPGKLKAFLTDIEWISKVLEALGITYYRCRIIWEDLVVVTTPLQLYTQLKTGSYTDQNSFSLKLISWFRWFNFNDNFVSPQNPESCISDSAYVLFYVREDQEWMPKWKPSPNNQLKPGELEICAHMYYLGILKSLQLVTFFFSKGTTLEWVWLFRNWNFRFRKTSLW